MRGFGKVLTPFPYVAPKPDRMSLQQEGLCSFVAFIIPYPNKKCNRYFGEPISKSPKSCCRKKQGWGHCPFLWAPQQATRYHAPLFCQIFQLEILGFCGIIWWNPWETGANPVRDRRRDVHSTQSVAWKTNSYKLRAPAIEILLIRRVYT